MKIKLIIGFSLAILLAIFALQNAETVTVEFLLWHLDISRTLLILLSIGMGIILSYIISFTRPHKNKSTEKNVTESEN